MKLLSFLLLFIQSIIEYFVRVLFYFQSLKLAREYISSIIQENFERGRGQRKVFPEYTWFWLSWGQILFCKLTVTKMTLASVVTLYKHTWYTYLAIIDKKLESPGVKFSFGNWLIKAILTSVVTFYDLLFEFLMSRNVKNAQQSE